jgi:hypothetical protein
MRDKDYTRQAKRVSKVPCCNYPAGGGRWASDLERKRLHGWWPMTYCLRIGPLNACQGKSVCASAGKPHCVPKPEGLRCLAFFVLKWESAQSMVADDVKRVFYRELYLEGMRRMPRTVQRHVLLCRAQPDCCLLCSLMRAAIRLPSGWIL